MEFNEKQQQILEVAERLFAAQGFEETSVRNIAQKANINVAMISYYFGSKDKLLNALLYYRLAHLGEKLSAIVEKDIGLWEKMDALIEILVNRIDERWKIQKIVNQEYSKKSREIDFDTYNDYKKKTHQLFLSLIEEGQQTGIFSKKVNAKLIPTTLFGTCLNFLYKKKFYQNLFGLTNEQSTKTFIQQELIPHLQQTIKALLTYEK